MSIKRYIKNQLAILLSVAGISIIINMILLTSIPLDESLEDIFYMDLLIIIIFIIGFSIHYLQIKKLYDKVLKAISDEEDVNYLLEKESNILGMNIMSELLEYKNKIFSSKEVSYQQKMNNLQDYITKSVHDLKVNLAVCEMVTNRFEIEDEKVDKIKFQIEHMKFRINQVLYITRANHYSEDIVSEHVDIGHVVKEAISDNREFFMSKDISIDVDIKPYTFITDKKWIHYIITQILNNSSKYIEKNGCVKIYSKEDDKGYYLHIKDDGIGILKEEIGRVFEKGFTGSNGRTNTKSTGMGMYYAKKIADLLGIDISIESESGAYTEFILSLYKLSDYMNYKSC